MEYAYEPKVSIVIPVYNGSNYLAEAIDSALAQTYPNVEIIVVNDGSNDDGATERIAKAYGKKVRYFSKENGGVSSALNFGIREMTGEWFSWLSHDDLYTPKKIERSVDALRRLLPEKRDKTIVYTDGLLVRSNKARIKALNRYFREERIYSGEEAACAIARKGTLCGCCLLIPRRAFFDIGFFDESLRYSQDTLMWYSIFLSGYSVYYSPYRDVLSRVHKQQVTNTRKDLFYRDALCVAKKIAPMFLRTNHPSRMFYFYLRKLTRLNCPDTVEYLKEFVTSHRILSKFQVTKLHVEGKIGSVIAFGKKMLKTIILK